VNTGTWVLLLAVVGALAFGLLRALTDGRFRGTHRVHGLSPSEPANSSVAEAPEEPGRESVLHGTPWAAELGERATLLQFSSAFCAPCRATRRVLDDVSSSLPGVEHLEVDAEHHLDVVRRFGIMRTPTTLVLDQHGHEVTRATGAPTPQQVLSALGRTVPDALKQPPGV